MRNDYDTVLSMAQMSLQNELEIGTITRELIANEVRMIISLNKRYKDSVDADSIIRELESRFSVWIGKESILRDDDGHLAWLTVDRKASWRYWLRYRLMLEKHWAPASIESLDRVTDEILSLMEDPNRLGPWDRRGLVVGHVQSGKTANYVGLICKAADAGYKIIVVLAGVHKNLRSQTQMRLDEGFLGYQSTDLRGSRKSIGVGLLDSGLRPDTITSQSDNGDFNKNVARSFSINPGDRPLLFVVKKNVKVLRHILGWMQWAAGKPGAERALVADVPLLVIDDEADHASVDTRQQEFDEFGAPNPDHDPTAINRCIRRILYAFEKSAYVGYTATPFANIFIHDRGRTAEAGEDLFPRSFIVNLPAPSNYVGPAKVFGLDGNTDTQSGLPLIRIVHDHADSLAPDERSGWMPPKHNNGHRPFFGGEYRIPSSLREAVLSFLLACAVRRARGQINRANSMLIHVTRFTNVQRQVREQVVEELESVRRRLRFGDHESDSVEEELRKLWNDDFLPTCEALNNLAADADARLVSWRDVEPHLEVIAKGMRVKEINGSAKDILDYETYRETGIDLIAIGGDKLARGLTLEGLSVSYFLRASKMYDTLMQMGRWFGYRPGYLDVCRLYTTPDLVEWFQHIAEASEELRQEFDHMAAVGGTPKIYGLKVRSHPVLMVTSRVKMRSGTDLLLSYSGSVSETVVFHTDASTVERNFRAAEGLISRLGTHFEKNPIRERPEGRSHSWSQTYVWRSVSAAEIKGYLSAVTTHDRNLRVDSRLLHDFIELQEAKDELTEWTVALVSGGTGGHFTLSGLDLQLVVRSPRDKEITDRYAIRRLLSPRDEAMDLDAERYRRAFEITLQEWSNDPARTGSRTPEAPSGPSIRAQRDPKNGLLLLYPLASGDAGKRWVEGDLPVLAFGISFPASEQASRVTYRVNNIYWAQEYGGEL